MDYQHVNQITDAINGLSYAIRSLNEPLGWIAIAAVVSTLVFVVRTIFGK